MGTNNLQITEGERLLIDGVELKGVQMYELHHSAGDTAELTVKILVKVNPADSELKQ